MPTLPATLMLTEAEREEVSRHLRKLHALCGQTPEASAEYQQATLVAVTQMMLALPSATQNELSAEARGEAFLDALDDLPTWSVRSAIRKWHRGECGLSESGQVYNYHWCPAPAELRRAAMRECLGLKAQAMLFDRMLKAQPLIEYSEKHCSYMRRSLSELFRFRNPPVGRHGSGGSVSENLVDGAHCGTQPKHNPASSVRVAAGDVDIAAK